MKDSYYEPTSVTVKKGETVRFSVMNEGELVHELSLGTPQMHQAHQKEMMKMVELGVLQADRIDRAAAQNSSDGSHRREQMAHDHANSVLLEPGESAVLTWTFNTSADLQFACNVPGHYEAGMTGDVRIRGAEGN